MATQMAYYPNAPSNGGMGQSPFQSRHAAGPSTTGAMGNSFLGAGQPRIIPGAESARPPIPPGRHMFHPFNRPYPKPGQDRSDYDSKQLRKSSMRKTVDYYSSVIRMLEVNDAMKYKDCLFMHISIYIYIYIIVHVLVTLCTLFFLDGKYNFLLHFLFIFIGYFRQECGSEMPETGGGFSQMSVTIQKWFHLLVT